MTISRQLGEALSKPNDGKRIRLALGQTVEVRTHGGELVTTGMIKEVDVETGFVRVVDSGSGVDLHVDVDPEHYAVWVPRSDSAPTPLSPEKAATIYVRPGLPGPWTKGTLGM